MKKHMCLPIERTHIGPTSIDIQNPINIDYPGQTTTTTTTVHHFSEKEQEMMYLVCSRPEADNCFNAAVLYMTILC